MGSTPRSAEVIRMKKIRAARGKLPAQHLMKGVSNLVTDVGRSGAKVGKHLGGK
jgi:hypothetical protein